MGPMVDDTVKVVRNIQQSLLEVSVAGFAFFILKVHQCLSGKLVPTVESLDKSVLVVLLSVFRPGSTSHPIV